VSASADTAAGDLTGTVSLVRNVLRRDRVRIVVWVASITVMVAASAASIKGLFPTQADIDLAAEGSRNPTILAIQGPDQGLDTLGGQIAIQIGAPGLAVVALMTLLMLGRLTRGEEEAGRLELIRSLPVGRRAPPLAAGIVVATMSLVVGVVIAVSLIPISASVTGSVSFGLGYVLTGWVFIGVALVCAQLTENTRVASGLAGCVLGASYLLRAVGDVGNGMLSWLSPLGWMQKARPYAGERWWPFLVALGAVVLLLLLARAMLERRDLGAGLVPPRRGRARATPRLDGPFALGARLQRGSLIGWTAGVVVGGLAYGAIASTIETFIRDNKTLADLLVGASGGDFVAAYLATSTRVMALIGAGFAVQSMMRMRSEESEQRAEAVLATGVSRTRWLGAHVTLAVAGSAVVMAATGLAIGVSAALVVGDGSLVWRVLGAAFGYAPAVWVLIGLASGLIGVRPEWAVAAWAVLSLGLVVAFLGPVLHLPGWVEGISPFEHVPLLPVESFSVLRFAVLAVLAAALGAAGVGGLEQRDIG
jgi:polyether ionophore transport system permease protein